MSTITPWLTCLTVLVAQPLFGDTTPRSIGCKECLVSLIDQARVSARRPGQITAVLYADGDEVADGEVLVQLDDRDAQARHKCAELELAIARHKSESRTLYQAALKSSALEELEFEHASRLFKRSVVARLEHERERTEAELAKIKIEETESGCAQADLIRQLREAELELAKIELTDYQVRAPYDGVIVELFHRRGDWVEPEQPVLRLLRMDRLKVETFLDSERIPPHLALGLPVTVTIPTSVKETRTIENCRIDYVCPELEAGGEFRVWVEVTNVRHSPYRGAKPRWLLRPGMTAEMRIELTPDVPQPNDDRLAGMRLEQ